MVGSPIEADIDELWFTRCSVPTATGVAHGLGWLAGDLALEGVTLQALQDAPDDVARDHHFTHRLATLVREGGNVPAIWARSTGAPTRVVGLTWVDEHQVVVARPGAGIGGPADLAGVRAALPEPAPAPPSVARAMALHGYAHALAVGGLALADVTFVDVPAGAQRGVANWTHHPDLQRFRWPGLTQVAAGEADVAYLKGALPAQQAAELGLEVVVDLDDQDDPRRRVGNGTPRPITVHQDLLDRRPDLVARFLATTIEAAGWAAGDLAGVRRILSAETGASPASTAAAYEGGFHRRLRPTLDPGRVALLEVQVRFLVEHGFIERAVDVAGWIDPGPLAAAHELAGGPRRPAPR